jgi:hypothetical protein
MQKADLYEKVESLHKLKWFLAPCLHPLDGLLIFPSTQAESGRRGRVADGKPMLVLLQLQFREPEKHLWELRVDRLHPQHQG